MISSPRLNKLFLPLLACLCLFFMACGKPAGTAPAAAPATVGPDPLAPYLWHLQNTGQSNFTSFHGTPGMDVNLLTSHNNYTGANVTIVVSDGRIDLNHPDLAANANLSKSRNYLLSSAPYTGNPTTTDNTDSHGTTVSSIAAAVKNNAQGGYGVAPSATLVGFNFIASDQSLSKYLSQTSLDGGEVFNYSYGTSTCEVSAVPASYIQVLRSNVIADKNLYVTAAGNDFAGQRSDCGLGSGYYFGNSNLDQSKSYPYLIVVAATNAQGVSAFYSTPGANTWISAPGGDDEIGIMGADLVGCSAGASTSSSTPPFDNNQNGLNPNCDYYSTGMGTSFASPIIAGGVALIRGANPALDWRDIKYILANTAVKIDPTAGNTGHPNSADLAGYIYQNGWVTNTAGYHFHNWYGFGQMDITAALFLATHVNFDLHELKSTDTLSDVPSYTSGVVNAAIPDNSAVGTTSTINVNRHNLVIEHVQIKVNITHTNIADLGIEITAPSGTKSKVLNINSGTRAENYTNITLGSNAFYGERNQGNWSIKVVDGAATKTGTLGDWSISFLGNRGPNLGDTTPPSPVSGLGNAGNTLSWAASPSGDVARYEACIYPTTTSLPFCLEDDWRTVGNGTSYAASTYLQQGNLLTLTSGVLYTFKIRAVDTSENESTVVSTSWTAP